MREALDIYDKKPAGMTAYLRYNGWHFNKKMCLWATSLLYKRNKTTNKIEYIEPWSKDLVETMLAKQGVVLDNNNGYDACFVANMAKADFYKSSLPDDNHLALYIKDVIDDADLTDGFIFSRFYSDCVRKGIGIPWDDVL